MSFVLLWTLAPAALASLGWLLWEARGFVRSLGRRDAVIALACVAVVGIQFSRQPHGLRVLSDEADFLNTAWSLVHTGQANGAPEWVNTDHGLRPLYVMPTFRPALFPALIALVGGPTGESPRTGIWLNVFFFGLLMFLAGRYAGSAWGWPSALAAGGLLAFHSQLNACAFSGGYDLLALLLFLVSAIAWLGGRFELALAAALAYAHTRVEGLLWVAMIVAGQWFLARERGFRQLALAGTLVIPLAQQRFAFPGHVQVPAGESLFSFARIPQNLSVWSALFVLAPVAVLLVFRGRRAALPATYLLLLLVFLLGFDGGVAVDPYQSRLYLPFWATLLILAGASLARLPRAADWGVAIALVVLAGRIAPDDSLWHHPMTQEFTALTPYVEASPETTLFVYPFPGHIAAYHRAAVQPWRKLEPGWGSPVDWIERLPPMPKAPGRPDWANAQTRKADLDLGAFRSLEIYEQNNQSK